MLSWQNTAQVTVETYTCGYCNKLVASEKGWYAIKDRHHGGYLRICPNCTRPTFFDELQNRKTPGAIYGNPVNDVSDKAVLSLYNEARQVVGFGAYTSGVLLCRKLLMHIAVSKGAETGQSFIKYVDFLAEKNYITPDCKAWVDHIRQKSNEANHEIVIIKKEDAEELISFLEMLLKLIFEFPSAMKKKTA